MADKMKQEIIERMNEYVAGHPDNMLEDGGRVFDLPLIGYASADDDMFNELKKPEIIGPEHWSPKEWLTDAKTIISYFLPFTEEMRESNREPGLPAEQLTLTLINGFNNAVRRYLADTVTELGGAAVAPVLEDSWHWLHIISNWSERHAAYIAGLGTFGLSKFLITEKGCAGRLGSVITSLEIEADQRPYTHFDQYCPFLSEGLCGECIKRCPAGAISVKGKNNWICKMYMDTISFRYAPGYGCAKCQMGVPCEAHLPFKN